MAVAPPLLLAQGLMYGFVAARAAHAVAYGTAQPHEVRATFYTIGSLIVMAMVVHALVAMIWSTADGTGLRQEHSSDLFFLKFVRLPRRASKEKDVANNQDQSGGQSGAQSGGWSARSDKGQGNV